MDTQGAQAGQQPAKTYTNRRPITIYWGDCDPAGIGFNPRSDRRHGLGLENMRQRVEQAHGSLTITSEIGKGTLIEAILPISATIETGRIAQKQSFEKKENNYG